jgi:dolichyl-phosphate-mannose-protein mannosyltransferase
VKDAELPADRTCGSYPSFPWLLGTPVVVGAFALAAYLLTMYPDLTGGDSGELIGAVATGGVIHPPGYPLYLILGKLFIHLPFRTFAWRMGLMSACCDACAAALLCLGLSRQARSPWAGVTAAGLFALSPGVWQYAICAEVFALNNLLVALLLLFTVLYGETRKNRYALAAALVFGLGLSNHQTILFVGTPLLACVLWAGRSTLLRPRMLGLLVAAMVVGLSPYVVLPIAGSRAALVSWGATNTWAGFWRHVLRSEYGTFQLAVTGVGADVSAMSIIAAWFDDLLHEVGWWNIALALFGVAAASRSSEKRLSGLNGALLVALGLCVLLFANLANLPVGDPHYRAVVARFWQQPELLVCVWCGLALSVIQHHVPWRGAPPTIAAR